MTLKIGKVNLRLVVVEVLLQRKFMMKILWQFPNVSSYIPEDRVIVFDPLNLVMKVGSLYPNMKVFRLTWRRRTQSSRKNTT